MPKLTAARLAAYLSDAAEILRGKPELSASIGLIAAILLIKRATDQPGFLALPAETLWSGPVTALRDADDIARVLADLEARNLGTLAEVSRYLDAPRGAGRAEVRNLLHHLDQISLSDNALEFGDVVGDAFNRFIDLMADTTGKQSGEFTTPSSVADLMARLAEPSTGMSVYDPFTGTGGFLCQALRYVREHDGDRAYLNLFGQELNMNVWPIAKINLLLNDAPGAAIAPGDTLADPAHIARDGGLMRFDRVLTNAPFSMNYDQRAISHPERMRYGWTSEHGKADLMIIQHVLASLYPDGVGVALAPLGVLFRGGAEADIRRGIIEDNRIDAIINLGPGILPGTSIPACLLVLRGAAGPRRDDRGHILFINAERETASSRTGSRLPPEAAETIVEVFRDRIDIPGFSRVVSLTEIADNGYNLNVRPYVNYGLPSEPPLDVHAIVYGGIPRKEVELASNRFNDFGIDLYSLFREIDVQYLDFPHVEDEAATGRITSITVDRELEFVAQCRTWWRHAVRMIAELADEYQLLTSRAELIDSFRAELLPMRLLGKYQLSSIFAAWWSFWYDDLRAMERDGGHGVLNPWELDGDPWGPDSSAPRIATVEVRDRALDGLGADLCARVQTALAAERQKLIDTYLSWRDRYSTPLVRLEADADLAAVRLKSRLRELGHADQDR